MNKLTMKENGFEYVDLSITSGTMWAICNVGIRYNNSSFVFSVSGVFKK